MQTGNDSILERISSSEEPLESKVESVEGCKSMLWGKLILNSDISYGNIIAWALQITILGIILASTPTLEPDLLKDEFGVSQNDIGDQESILILIDYGIKIMLAPFIGYIVDRFGRRRVFAVSVATAVTGYFLIPLATTVYTTYLPFKSLISAGVIGMNLIPLQADYVHNSCKGFSSGVTYTVAFFGAGIGALIISICSSFPLKVTYITIGFITMALGILTTMYLKPGRTYYLNKNEEESIDQPFNEKLAEVMVAIKEVPWIPIGLLCTILGNTDFYIITTGLTLWIQGLSSGTTSSQASADASTYQIIFYLLSIITSIYYGVIVQKSRLMRFLSLSMGFSFLGLCFVPFVNDPHSIYLYIIFVIEGISLPGIFLFSTFSSARYNPPKHRGILTAIGNVIGMAGAVFILVLGGQLYDDGIYDASYLLYTGLLVICFIGSLLIYQTKKKYLLLGNI